MENAHIGDLTAQLKALEKKEADPPRRSRTLEIIKLRAEVNKIETQKTIQRINETKSWFFEKINKNDTPLSKLIKRQREICKLTRSEMKRGTKQQTLRKFRESLGLTTKSYMPQSWKM